MNYGKMGNSISYVKVAGTEYRATPIQLHQGIIEQAKGRDNEPMANCYGLINLWLAAGYTI